MVTLISYMVESQYLTIRQTNLQQIDELSLFANSQAELWGKNKLIKADQEAYVADHEGEAWASETFIIEDEFGQSATLSDLHSRFNINNLTGQQQDRWRAIFENLLTELDIDNAVALTIIDWVDQDQSIASIDGAEDAYYESLNPPHLAGNQPLAAIEELLLIKGISDTIYDTLLPHVSALDADDVKININTASVALLNAIRGKSQNGVSSFTADQLISARATQPFFSIEEVLENDFFAGVENLNDIIAVKSEYFEMESSVEFESNKKKFRTGFKREVDEASTTISVVYRKRVL